MIAPIVRELMSAGLAGEELLAAIERIDAAGGFSGGKTKGAERTLDVSADEWAVLRATVFDRDGFTCRYCGEEASRAPQCDHAVPLSRGGKSVLANLVTACKACNSGKKDRTPEEWRPACR